MIEDELRAVFARHESLVPATEPLRRAIDRVAERRRSRQLQLRLTGAVLAVLVALVAGAPVLAHREPERARLLPATTPTIRAGALNFLLVGVDGDGQGQRLRADSIMIAHVPASRDRLYLVSLPRDLEVSIPGYGRDKLNSAFLKASTGGNRRSDLRRGLQVTVRTVRELTGVSIDGGAVLTYSGLRLLTDKVGGVPVCLPTEVRSLHTRRVLPKGCHRMGGDEAVDLLRQKYGLPEGARDRERNAQRFVEGFRQRFGDQVDNIIRLHELMQAAGDGLLIDAEAAQLPVLPSVIDQLASTEVVGITLDIPVIKPGGTYQEWADPLFSQQLFTALREDRAAQWVVANPDYVTP